MANRNGLTLGHILKYHAFLKPNKTAIVFRENRYTWKEFNLRTNRLAHALLDEGVKKGDVVSIWSLNCNQYLELYFACGKIGAIMNAVNFRLSPEEIKRGMVHSESKLEIVDWFFEQPYSQIVDGLPSKGKAVPVIGEPTVDNGIPFEEFIKDRSDSEPAIEIDPEDPVLLQYTSGTTGSPKGALLTHNNFVWDALVSIYHQEITFDDKIVVGMPFFHCAGLHILTDAALLKGCTIGIVPLWNAEQVCQLIHREQATHVFVIMPLMSDFMNTVRSGKYDLSSLKIIGTSAAPHSSAMLTELLYRSGARNLLFGYGLTEASPSVTSHLTTSSILQKEGNSIGVPILSSEIRVVDSKGNDVPKGESGELIVRGPQVFKGYIKDEKTTKQTLKNGWLYTGDLVKEDEDGHFWFIGRSKDMIKSGGENVFADEVEQSIMKANPEVGEVAVYGKPDERWGEAVAAACLLKPGATLTEEEVISRTKKVLAHYKVPKYVYFVKEFPRTGSGKVAKHMLPELEKQHG